mmetsp:Transcript_16950/g.18865  ORF Transcript_16950/g.18865 Transcript_16950/m.18865 type:complete len:124 (+) Transcript_16950:281-652(+)
MDYKEFLEGYYTALNKREIGPVLQFLDKDVEVTFSDPKRNWKGLEIAQSKFELMYNRNPEFYSKIMSMSQEAPSNDRKTSSVVIQAWFGKEQDIKQAEGSKTTEMRYTLAQKGDQWSIMRIEH